MHGWDRGCEGVVVVGVTPGQQRDPRGYFGFLLVFARSAILAFLWERVFLGT